MTQRQVLSWSYACFTLIAIISGILLSSLLTSLSLGALAKIGASVAGINSLGSGLAESSSSCCYSSG
jgi:hypothetical protein